MAHWKISSLRLAAIVGAMAAGAVLWHAPLFGAEAPVIIAPPLVDDPKADGPAQTAVLSGGGFWGVQGVFEHVRGVKNVISGYAGRERNTPQYHTLHPRTTRPA